MFSIYILLVLHAESKTTSLFRYCNEVNPERAISSDVIRWIACKLPKNAVYALVPAIIKFGESLPRTSDRYIVFISDCTLATLNALDVAVVCTFCQNVNVLELIPPRCVHLGSLNQSRFRCCISLCRPDHIITPVGFSALRNRLAPTSFRNDRCTFPLRGLAQDYLSKTSPEFTEFFEIDCSIKPLN